VARPALSAEAGEATGVQPALGSGSELPRQGPHCQRNCGAVPVPQPGP